MVLESVTWIIGLISIALCASAFGNGANDVANAYATSIAARSLTLMQVGVIAMFTEFIGAVALGSRVTSTIKSGIITIDRFENDPTVFVLAMACAEFGSATWLIVATRAGFPVSTTQTIVGALIGAGFASQATITWDWSGGSVSQVAASWAIAPCLAGAISAILFATLKYGILERNEPYKKAMRAIPFYFAFTCAVLAFFFLVEIPVSPGIEGEGALHPGVICGIVFGVFFGILAISYIFFVPYFKAKIDRGDTRLRLYHVVLGPLLLRENPPLFWPAKHGHGLTDYYASEAKGTSSDGSLHKETSPVGEGIVPGNNNTATYNSSTEIEGNGNSDGVHATKTMRDVDVENGATEKQQYKGGMLTKDGRRLPEPEERWLHPYKELPIFNPTRLWNMLKYFFLQGVSRDCVTYSQVEMRDVHSRAKHYDNRVEHLWTYAQVLSAMIMSIAHGSNDVANALGPWVGAYNTWQTGTVESKADTPIWIIIIAGFLLGAGFWFFGYHIIRSLGNKITQMSPVRGFSAELGAAITVLLASILGLPVSTTQCITGAIIGVALMNMDARSINWKQMAFIFSGWVLTLPAAGLISGLLMLMALNAPSFS